MSVHTRALEEHLLPTRQVTRIANMQVHDVRNIASSLYLAAEELQGSQDVRTRILGARIFRACERIAQVCECSVAKTKSQQRLLGITRDVAELGASVAEANTKVTCCGIVDQNLGRIATAVFRILANLVFNAVTALNASRGGEVSIRTHCKDGRTLIFVEDTGTGTTPKEQGIGSGLGLLIADSLAIEIKAKLERKQYKADGTVYCLTLPIAVPEGGKQDDPLSKLTAPLKT